MQLTFFATNVMQNTSTFEKSLLCNTVSRKSSPLYQIYRRMWDNIRQKGLKEER
jgi:hypothetical protein